MQGTIKKLASDKGYGFIRPDSGKDIFFHAHVLENAGFDELQVGDEVDFQLDTSGTDTRGPRAAKVAVLWE